MENIYVLRDRNEEIKIELNLWSTKERMGRLFVFYVILHLHRTFIASLCGRVCVCALYSMDLLELLFFIYSQRTYQFQLFG